MLGRLGIALALVACAACASNRAGSESTRSPASGSTRICAEAPHSAFTDLVRFQGRFYCAFREGSGHVPGAQGSDGRVRVLASDDGRSWHSVASLVKEGIDLRDPKLSVTPDGRLMVLMGGSLYDGHRLLAREPQAAFSDVEGNTFSEPIALGIDAAISNGQDWLWRVTWHEGVGYGMVYQANDPGPWGLHLVRTLDGLRYEAVATLDVDGRPNEATLRFLPDGEMVAVLRREGGDRLGRIGFSHAPYEEWTWRELPQRLGGPEFVALEPDRFLVGSRYYEGPDGPRTCLFVTDRRGALLKRIELTSGGDTSYPGMLVVDDELWVSYYSSHEGSSSIYLQVLPLERFRDR